MSIRLYDGDFDELTGGIFASWFISNPKGPTASAVGFVETADMPWALFYRRMQSTGGRTYLGAAVDEEISAAPDNFGEVVFNLMIGLTNHIACSGCDEPLFSEIPTFVRTNGNPDVDAAMRWLIANAPNLRGAEWERELHLRKTCGAGFFGSAGEQFGQVDEKKMHRQPTASEAPFARWWELVTDKAYVEAATFQFAQAWVGAVHAGKDTRGLNRLAPQDGWMFYSEVARFFDNFYMPLLPREIGE
jgi:hypothetical protein